MIGDAEARRPLRRGILLALKWVLLTAVIVWVGRAMIDAYDKVDFSRLTFEPWWIAIGLAVIAAGVLSAAWTFRGFYRKMGTPLNTRQGVALLTMPMLGAYLPGRALCVAGHMGIARAMGVPLPAAGAGVVLLAGLGLLAALLVGLGMLLIQPVPGIDPKYMRISLAAALVLALVVLHPRLYFGLINYVLRRLKREPLEAGLPLKDMLAMLAGMCGYVAFFVAGFVALGRGIMDLPMGQTPMMIGAVTLATTIGFLSVFTPAGLGVREGLLLLFLSRVPGVGEGQAAVLTVSLRLMQILVDIALAGIGVLIYRRLKKTGAAQDV